MTSKRAKIEAIERRLCRRRVALGRALIDCRRLHGDGIQGVELEVRILVQAVDEIIELELARMRLMCGQALQ